MSNLKNTQKGAFAKDIEQASKLLVSGDYVKSADIVTKILKQDPNEPDALHLYGIIANAGKQHLAAIQAISKAITQRPNRPDYYSSLGTSYKDYALVGKARVCFEKAIELNNSEPVFYYNLGNTLLKIGDKEGALKAFNRAIELKPKFAEAYFHSFVASFDPNDLAPCIQKLSRAIECKPTRKYYFYLGVALELSGDDKNAKIAFENAIKLRKEDGEDPYIESWNYIRENKSADTRLYCLTADGLQFAVSFAQVDGLFLEFGVRFGTTINQIAGLTTNTVHGFDSFEGIPEEWDTNPAGSYTTDGQLPLVRENVKLYKGWFEDTLPDFINTNKEPVAFMNIDCDIYSATKTIFAKFGSRIVKGTIIVFDEYILNNTWKEDEFKAFQEAVEEFGWKYKYLGFAPYSKQAIIKITDVK